MIFNHQNPNSMKHFLLLVTALSIGFGTFGQTGFDQTKYPRLLETAEMTLNKLVKEQAVEPVDFVHPDNMLQTTQTKATNFFEETHIMTTQYDLQTNASLSGRVLQWPDGTAAATATMGVTVAPGFPDRGTGYSYHDGASWETHTGRIEPVRSGWPSLVSYGENGEAIFSHGGTPFGINMYVRENKGTGDWVTHYNFPNPEGYELTWPRAVVSGENNQYINLIAADQDATTLDSYLFFTRSTDGGETWAEWSDVPLVLSEDYYFGISADDYTGASNGNTIAFLFADAFYDLFFIKSDDNGENWEKQVVFEHPYPDLNADFENALFDTTYLVDNSGNIAIDNDGNVHIVWGTVRYLKSEVGMTWTWFPFVNGIGYWNETMGPLPEHPNGPLYTLEPDYLFELGMLAGWTPDLDGDGSVNLEEFGVEDLVSYRTPGLATMPTIAIDNTNNIGIFFSTVNETRWNDVFYYRSIFATYRDGLFGTWYYMADDLMEGFIHLFDEGIFPTTASRAYEGPFFLTYMADVTQGLAFSEDHPYQDNQIYAVKISQITGVANQSNPITNLVGAYPNPVSGQSVQIDINLSRRANDASISLYNLAGQQVYNEKMPALAIGMNQLKVDVSQLQAGVYFYSLVVDGFKETRKLVVQ
jgi:hypothetical protein